ncbi:DUF4082 domain-containing protein [Nonomuraea sp. NPDC000554]|uniref:DUF4082 domain-containing protein n=1 Tax=Nonomuraea sp. NPDC000554 TaxID=3154259 RepID=UPI00331EC37E
MRIRPVLWLLVHICRSALLGCGDARLTFCPADISAISTINSTNAGRKRRRPQVDPRPTSCPRGRPRIHSEIIEELSNMSQIHRGKPDQSTVAAHARRRAARIRRTLSGIIARTSAVVALAAGLSTGVAAGTAHAARAGQPPVSLGNAASFGVFAGSAVTNTNLTTVTGDLGVSPGSSVVGFPPGTVTGTIHAGDSAAGNARTDMVAAYNDVAGRAPVTTIATELGGTTRGPGVYNSGNGTFTITGTLTLDAQGDPDAVFIFQASSLSTANVSNINLLRGAQANNLFWQVSGSATLGTFCTFRGNVLALSSVTVNTGAAVFGRVFAVNNNVILQGTSGSPQTRITVPNDPPTTTALSLSPNPSKEGQTVTFTATVSAVSGSVIPQGEVVFRDGANIIGSSMLNSSGVATFATASLTPAQHLTRAVYLGGDTFDGEALIHFAPSKSPQLVQTVSASLWDDATTPAVASQNDPNAVVVGVRFKTTTTGSVTGIRFYKGPQNTGTHTGSLWTSGGTLLASAVFTDEIASGWQQVNFGSPVALSANTTYVASYHTTSGGYSMTRPYFTSQFTNNPLIALADGDGGGNGVFSYSATNTFPTSSFQATNYWVDVVFVPSSGLWDDSATPAAASHGDPNGVVLGVRFKPTASGSVRGIRFYKGPQNTGTHIGTLWTSDGTPLASAVFTGESASGWQEVNFGSPVALSANTTYVVSYHTTSGGYAVTRPYFTSQYANGVLIAPADGDGGRNGVYTYSTTNAFPTSTYQATNYWVDVMFDLS